MRLFGRELDPLTLAEELEHGSTDRAPVKEVLDAALVADEAEPLVNQEPSDCSGWHDPKPPFRNPQGYPKGTQPGNGRLRTNAFAEAAVERESGRVFPALS